VSRFEPQTGQWRTFTAKEGLAGDSVRAIHQSPEGALWFGTDGGGVSRFEPQTEQWRTFTTKEGLAGDSVQAIHQSPDGALWFGTNGGVSLALLMGQNPGRFGAVVNVQTFADYDPTLVVTGQTVIRTRAGGLLFTVIRTRVPSGLLFSGFPAETWSTAWPVANYKSIQVLTAGPDGTVWAGERLGSLSLHRADGTELRLTAAQGLSSMHIRALAPVDRAGARVWVGTAGGAARVGLASNALQIERTADYTDGLPTGPVATLTAQADGSALLAYNFLDAKWFFNNDLAQRRASSRVYFVPTAGAAGQPILFYRGNEPLVDVDIRALALSGTTLWAGTSAGLFKAERPTAPNARLELVTAPNIPQVPIRQLKVHPTTGDIWFIAKAQQDVPARLIGYDPARDTALTVGPDQGLPSWLMLHDFTFTDDGQLVVLADVLVFKGFMRVGGAGWPPYVLPAFVLLVLITSAIWLVFYHPLVRELRAQPEKLRQLPLPAVAVALKRLQRAWALDEVRQRLALSSQRLDVLKTLAAGDSLSAVATLLGVTNAAHITVDELHKGLRSLPMRLPYPETLHRQAFPLISVDPQVILTDDEPTCRIVIQQALETLGLRFEWPFLMLCRDADKGRRLLPDGYIALIIDEPVLRELAFAPQPPQTLVGLLLTRGLLALSPYSSHGEVQNPSMFYGRDRELREMMQAAAPQWLLVGPRRIGKSSLLRRLQNEFPRQHPTLHVVSLDLLGIGESARLAQLLARRLQRTALLAQDAQVQAAHIDDMLRSHFTELQHPGLIMIDEADTLVETDAAADFPLLNRLRSLQADGVCSFILAGYWYLYLRTLDQGSPVHNFATVRELRPLDAESGRILASEPMARLGITYASPNLPTHIVQHTGGYPSLIQFLCDQLLKQLERDRTLVITPTHLAQVEQSQAMHNHLVEFFRMNTGSGTQLSVYCLLEAESFTQSEAHTSLEGSVRKTVPLWVIDQILLQLTLYGLVTKTGDGYHWTIPLVRNILLADAEREYRVQRLLQELPEHFAAWITPQMDSGSSAI
jgi:hypothetical protein